MRYRFALLLLLCGCGLSFGPNGLVRIDKPNVVTPSVDQITGKDFRCLIVEDDSIRQTLTSEQRKILFGKEVRDFLREHCAKDDKGNPLFRFVDRATEFSGDWGEMLLKARPTSLPWIILQDGKAIEGAPITTFAALKPLLDKYSGAK